MKIILKLAIVKSKNGSKSSITKHIQLGDKLKFDLSDQNIESIELLDVKFIYGREDVKANNDIENK
jgi:hypothetical protein